MKLFLLVILISFFLAAMDSATGMGFGTGVSPLLFLLGYSPLQIVPSLLISQTITGLISAYFDNEMDNVSFSFTPVNDATKYALYFALIGCLSVFFSILLVYFTIKIPELIIEIYVAVLVLFMGCIGVLKLTNEKDLSSHSRTKPKLLLFFSAIAGFNKGISGGGYGPIITLGQLFSGVYEKSARAIVAFAEGLVSVMGVFSFFLISWSGIEIDLILLPSIFTGGFFGALISPYLVRILPNKIWKVIIPLYAIILSVFSLINILF
jgi:hypothetical protein